MAQQQVDPQAVIANLSVQIGQYVTQIAMRDVLLGDLEKQVAELQATLAQGGAPAADGTLDGADA